ncbi:hypothetical protein ACG9ZL_20740 [Acinetobacter sp. ULE_I057]|uniref:hypothetical protein n=1 Tax=Acinetobacter sp. ULE_I057 TaxID=3373070 RepID=UPI003AF67338
MEKFKEWFVSQYFYTNMRFVHGDALFDKDGDFFRILAVQIAWEAWQSRQAEVDELSSQNQILKEVAESDTKTIERLESVINLNDSELKDKDKRIEAALNHLNDVRNKGTDQSCYLAIKALRGNNANS